MKVNTATIDITPHNSVKLCGYVNEIRNNQRTNIAHAPIYAMAMRFECKENQLLILTLDILSISKEKADEIKEVITSHYPIRENEIIIHAIHTHSGPSGFSMDAMGREYEENKVYQESVIKNVLKGLEPVFESGIECYALIGETNIKGYYDNRNDINRYFDSNASVIRFMNNKNIIAELVNINVHSTVLGPKNMKISYDLIGTVREKIFEKEKIRPIICIGTSADISNRHFRKGDDFDELERTAAGIAKELMKIKDYKKINLEKLKIKKFNYYLSYDNTVNFPEYEKELEKLTVRLVNEDDETKRKLMLSSKDKFETKLKIKKVEKNIEISIISFPELLILTFPGELTSVFGKYIKEKSGYLNTIIVTCTNGHHGYFIEEDLYGKCYESTATLIPRGETEKMMMELGKIL